MSELLMAVFNFQAGGHRIADDTFDMRPLQQAFAGLETAPALVLLCEGKYYRRDQYRGLRLAEQALTRQLGVPYFGLLGTLRRGPIPPAMFYNTDQLTCLHWPDEATELFDEQHNVGRFRVNATGNQFGAWVAHLDPLHGCDRLHEAKRFGRYGTDNLPYVGGGDMNCSASGPHFPQRDWSTASHAIVRHKGTHAGFDTDAGVLAGPVRAATAPLDYLIGAWDPATGSRRQGAGHHAIAELAWQHNPSSTIAPSVIDKPGEGGADLIDYLLVNNAMRPHVDLASYRVHTPETPPYPSDHHLITAVINL